MKCLKKAFDSFSVQFAVIFSRFPLFYFVRGIRADNQEAFDDNGIENTSDEQDFNI